jgi:hypothetical protein
VLPAALLIRQHPEPHGCQPDGAEASLISPAGGAERRDLGESQQEEEEPEGGRGEREGLVAQGVTAGGGEGDGEVASGGHSLCSAARSLSLWLLCADAAVDALICAGGDYTMVAIVRTII